MEKQYVQNSSFIPSVANDADERYLVKTIDELLAEMEGGGRQSNPALANITDLVPWAIYDTNRTSAGANTSAQYVFFNQPIGTNNKTKVDTNLEQVMALANPEWIDVSKIAFTLAPNTAAADATNLLSSYYFEFWVGGKIYAEGPLEIAAGKTGLYANTTRTSDSYLSLGQPVDNDGGFDLRLPPGIQLVSPEGTAYTTDGVKGCRILQGQQFQVKLIGNIFAAAGAGGTTFGIGVNVRCYLKGVKSRIAQ